MGGGLAASNTLTPFTGTYTATACGPEHEFEITDDSTKTIILIGAALNPANDITLQLNGPDGTAIATADLRDQPGDAHLLPRHHPAGHLLRPGLPVRRRRGAPAGQLPAHHRDQRRQRRAAAAVESPAAA